MYNLACMRTLQVTCADASNPSFLFLRLNRNISTVGTNSCFKMEILRGILPKNNTALVFVTDPSGLLLPAFTRNGQFLRADALLKYVCSQHCRAVTLFSFYGTDPLHVSVLNKGMCPSGVVQADTATYGAVAAAQTVFEKVLSKSAPDSDSTKGSVTK